MPCKFVPTSQLISSTNSCTYKTLQCIAIQVSKFIHKKGIANGMVKIHVATRPKLTTVQLIYDTLLLQPLLVTEVRQISF